MSRFAIDPEFVGADEDDPIVWQYGRYRTESDGRVETRVAVMTRSCRDRLLDMFGESWLRNYCAERVQAIDYWAGHTH